MQNAVMYAAVATLNVKFRLTVYRLKCTYKYSKIHFLCHSTYCVYIQTTQNSTMFSEIIAVNFKTDSYSKRNSEG